jgi:cysteine desulfurase
MDVQTLDVGSLSLSAHKLYGPKGIGALYIRRDLQAHVEPLMYGGGQQRGLRPGTLPVPLCVGFGEAATLMTDEEARAERRRISDLRDRLMVGLCSIRSGIQMNGPTAADRHPGNLNIRFPDVDAHGLLMSMQPWLAAATGSACTSGIPEPSHVLRAVGLTDRQAKSSVRFGIGRFTTQDEIERAIEIVRGALTRAS